MPWVLIAVSLRRRSLSSWRGCWFQGAAGMELHCETGNWQGPQPRQCPHQPGTSPAVSELDGQRWLKAPRSHQQPQARQSEKSSLEFIQGFSQEQQRGPEPIQERQWMNQCLGEQDGAKECLQHSSGKVWVSGSGSKWSPWTHRWSEPWQYAVRARREKGKLLVKDLCSQGSEGTATVHLV